MEAFLKQTKPGKAWRPLARSIALITMCSFTVLTFASCVRMRVAHDLYSDPAPSVAISLFHKPVDYRAGGPTVSGIVSELYLHKDSRWQLVQREAKGSYLIDNLIPGKYKVVTAYRLLDTGEREDLSGETEETFMLNSGERAQLTVILEKTPVVLIVMLSVTVVLLLAFLIILLADSDLDLPDLPTPSDLLDVTPFFPPLPGPADMMWIGMDFMIPPYGGTWADDSWDREYQGAAARIFDHYPRNSAVGVAPDTDISFQVSSALAPDSLDHRYFIVTNERNELIKGGIYYLEDTRTCVYDPLRPLPPNSTITVTVLGENLKTENESAISDNYRWSFTTGS